MVIHLTRCHAQHLLWHTEGPGRLAALYSGKSGPVVDALTFLSRVRNSLEAAKTAEWPSVRRMVSRHWARRPYIASMLDQMARDSFIEHRVPGRGGAGRLEFVRVPHHEAGGGCLPANAGTTIARASFFERRARPSVPHLLGPARGPLQGPLIHRGRLHRLPGGHRGEGGPQADPPVLPQAREVLAGAPLEQLYGRPEEGMAAIWSQHVHFSPLGVSSIPLQGSCYLGGLPPCMLGVLLLPLSALTRHSGVVHPFGRHSWFVMCALTPRGAAVVPEHAQQGCACACVRGTSLGKIGSSSACASGIRSNACGLAQAENATQSAMPQGQARFRHSSHVACRFARNFAALVEHISKQVGGIGWFVQPSVERSVGPRAACLHGRVSQSALARCEHVHS